MLKEKEEELKELIKSLPIAAFFIDANHRVVYWNKACEKLTCVKANEIVGTDKAWIAFYSDGIRRLYLGELEKLSAIFSGIEKTAKIVKSLELVVRNVRKVIEIKISRNLRF